MSDDFPRLNEFPEPPIPSAGITPLPGSEPAFLPPEVGQPLASAPAPLALTDTMPLPLVDPIDSDYTRTVDGLSRHEGAGSLAGNRPAIDLAGKLDCYLARVVKTYWGGTHPVYGVQQGIDTERIEARWNATNNDPVIGSKPSPRMGTSGLVSALPFPMRGDQAAYHVEAGDVVTILQSGDGQAVYLADDLPFIGKVVVWDDDDVTEEFNGGTKANGSVAGLKVRQQIMTGNPSSSAATLADREAIHDAWITNTAYIVDDCVVQSATTYRCMASHTSGVFATDLSNNKWESDNIVIHRYVNVLRTGNQAIGYRVGDDVLVVRRGSYLFCLPIKDTFLALTSVGTNSGPSSAADFTDEHYWMIEVDPVVAYSTDAWTFYPSTPASRSANDPTGSGGRKGCYIDAVNLTERAAETHLLADGLLIQVTMWADLNEAPYYTFTHKVVELPSVSGKSQYMVLQLDGSSPAVPIWDWVRAHG